MKNKNNQKFTTGSTAGFTLVEVLVAALVFAVIVASAGGLFVQGLRIQHKTLAIQELLENTQLALEMMTREIRVSAITSGDAPCFGVPDPSNEQITLNHPVYGVVSYQYEPISSTVGGRIIRVNTGNDSPITASKVDIRSFAFCVIGSENDGRQARVTISAIVAPFGAPSEDNVSFQTTITLRSIRADFVTP